jgi:hypothetical protein
MNEPTSIAADFASHHIEGYARAAVEQGRDGRFSVPLISEVLPGLWQGGCINGVRLGDEFDLVISLYPWEKYTLGPNTERVEFTAYDAAEVPNVAAAAQLAYDNWKDGKRVLIHCQAGLNRSGLVSALVLMGDGYSADDAITLLREKRCPMVLCNAAFERYLRELVEEAA